MYKLPSGGFIAICLTYCLVFGFFMWGFTTPELDRVWTICHEIQSGKTTKLQNKDLIILSRNMAKYPNLAGELLKGKNIGLITPNNEGWSKTGNAIVLRTPDSVTDSTLNIKLPGDQLFQSSYIEVRGNCGSGDKWRWQKKIKISQTRVVKITLPCPSRTPEIIEISFIPAIQSSFICQIGFPLKINKGLKYDS